MARRAASDNRGTGEWVRSFGEQLGQELGRIIADSLQRTLLSSIDVSDIARRLGGGGGRRGRRAGGQKAVCGEAGCPNPVLAKGLCRSHYYRARYRAQKAGAGRRGRGGARGDQGGARRRGRGRRGGKGAPESASGTEPTAG